MALELLDKGMTDFEVILAEISQELLQMVLMILVLLTSKVIYDGLYVGIVE